MTSNQSANREHKAYVLTTAAHNEAENIARTLDSVLRQTQLPERWVIISDRSTDRTDEIVQEYARKTPWIRFLQVTRPAGRNFAAKVRAIHAGMPLLDGAEYGFIGNVDADVSLEPHYFAQLLDEFASRPKLGIAGGFFYEEQNGQFQNRRANRIYSVTHAAQLVRRECFDQIGGYAVLEFGGEDWHAEIAAKMKGWEVEAFPALKIFHHRHTGEGGNLLRYRFRQGRMDYAFGSDPLFETLKCLHRMGDSPLIAGGSARLCGFLYAFLHRDQRPVGRDFVDYLRKEQRSKIGTLLGRGKNTEPIR
jgi:poly-beta-1,6-N-acetyl-D-glucosamine synthase